MNENEVFTIRLRLFPAIEHVQLANLVTSLVVVLGFLAILQSAAGELRFAAIALAIAAGLDRIDGMIARRLGQSSPMGAELDSLADAVTFCAAPAALAYYAAPTPAVLVAAVAFTLCGVWRLAHFNVTGLTDSPTGPAYTGVPTTIAASWLIVLLSPVLVNRLEVPSSALAVILVAFALAMISALPYPKNGWPTRSLYVVLPIVIAALLLI